MSSRGELTPVLESMGSVDSYRLQSVHLSASDCGPDLQISGNGLKLSAGRKGYQSCRASVGARTGTWLCEITVDYLPKRSAPAPGHIRLGWGGAKAEINAPVGFDRLGYGIRDMDGATIHEGFRTEYAGTFREGDVIGMAIHLPTKQERETEDTKRDRNTVEEVAISTANSENQPQQTPTTREDSSVLKGSWCRFFINGRHRGVAFTDLSDPGEYGYYPMISLYYGAQATFNPGPNFFESNNNDTPEAGGKSSTPKNDYYLLGDFKPFNEAPVLNFSSPVIKATIVNEHLGSRGVSDSPLSSPSVGDDDDDDDDVDVDDDDDDGDGDHGHRGVHDVSDDEESSQDDPGEIKIKRRRVLSGAESDDDDDDDDEDHDDESQKKKGKEEDKRSTDREMAVTSDEDDDDDDDDDDDIGE